MGQRRLELPIMNAARTSIRIPEYTANWVFRNETISDLGHYQSKYNILEFLPMNQDKEFNLHTIMGDPLLWQADDGSCSVTPMGGQRWKKTSISPSKLRAFMKICVGKELYETMFRAMMKWEKSGRQNTAEFLKVLNPIIKEDQVQLAQSLIATALLGSLFDYGSIGFSGNATPQNQSDFEKQANAFNGILNQVKTSTVNTMYDETILPDTILDQAAAGIDISDVANKLFNVADPELQRLIARGQLRDGRGGTVRPVLIVSSNFFGDLFNKAKDVADLSLQNSSIFREITVVEDGNVGHEYRWRNVPIVPLDELCIYDQYLNSRFYFAAFTSTRNIQIGTNFGKFDRIEQTSVGATYQRIADDDIDGGDAGAIYRDTHALLAADIANEKLFTSTFKTY